MRASEKRRGRSVWFRASTVLESYNTEKASIVQVKLQCGVLLV